MGKQSREEDILELFFEEPTKHWHFSKIKEAVPIADNKVSRWLKAFIKRGLIKKFTPKNKMPYYISDYENPEYQTTKRIYALRKLHDSGLLNHLSSLEGAKTVILFGSFTRWDWHTNSDIDLFIFGKDDLFEQGRYEKLLKRDIQVFNCKNKKALKKFNNALIKNIIKGDIIKGDINFLEVSASA